MGARPLGNGAAGTPNGRLAWIAPLGVAALGLFAYWPLLPDVLQIPSRYQVEHWFFRPSELPVPLVLATAGWLLWRRLGRLRALPPRRASRRACALLVVGGATFVWATLTRTADLLLPSLAAHGLALAAATRGRAGFRTALLPALVLLLGMRIPGPLLHELVWQLQLSTTAAAAWLLGLFDGEVLRGGVMIFRGDHAFHVIEGCSGLRGIEILVLVALVVRELFSHSGRRQWLVVLVAPALGWMLNAVRIALVALSASPEAYAGAASDHTPQGVAVLVVGTAILYALGWGLSRGRERRASAPDAGGMPADPAPAWGIAAVWLALLGALAIAVSPFAEASARARRGNVALPESHAGWTSEALRPDPLFTGVLAGPDFVHRRYEFHPRTRRPGPPWIVEVFAAREASRLGGRLLSAKHLRPGPAWSIDEEREVRLWMLEREAVQAIASETPGDGHAMVYRWALRDAGLWQESARSLLALESSPLRREEPRVLVRLVTPVAHDGSMARDRAKQVLDRFIVDFREPLAGL